MSERSDKPAEMAAPAPPMADEAPKATEARVAKVLADDLVFRALCAVEVQRGTSPIYVVEKAPDHTRVAFLSGVHQANARQLGQAAELALDRAGFATALDLSHPPTVRVVGG